MGKELTDKMISERRWQGVRVWVLGMSGEGHPTRGSRKGKGHMLCFRAQISANEELPKHDECNGPQEWGPAAVGSDAVPQAPEAPWMTPRFRVRLHLCCSLDSSLLSDPKARFPRREGTSVSWHNSRSTPSPAKCFAYQLCIAKGKFRQTWLSPKGVYCSVWLICACPLSNYWQ